MALAKFREDIVSRFHQATVIRAKEHDALLTPEAEPKGAPTKLKGFAAPQSRPLPVIVLADISGSMSVNGKIDAFIYDQPYNIVAVGQKGQGKIVHLDTPFTFEPIAWGLQLLIF